MIERFPAMSGSPFGRTIGITAADGESVSINKVGIFPDAPNIIVVSYSNNPEYIRYGAKTEVNGVTTLTQLTRGFGETQAQEWQDGTLVSRAMNDYDMNSFINIIRSASRDATFVVAGVDAPDSVKGIADYNCDGVDDQVEIMAAVNALTSGRTWPEKVKCIGSFSCSDTIWIREAAGIYNSHTILDLSEAYFYWEGLLPSINYLICLRGTAHLPKVTINTDAAIGDTVIYVDDATAVSVGDYVSIRCSTQNVSNMSGPKGELRKVTDKDVLSVPNSVTIDEGLWQGYLVSETSYMYKVTMLDDVHVIGGMFEGPIACLPVEDGYPPPDLIEVTFVSNYTITGIESKNITRRCIIQTDCVNGDLSHNNIYGSAQTGYGYGISLHGACTRINIHHNTIQYCRHMIVGGYSDSGSPMYCSVNNNVLYAGNNARNIIDLHNCYGFGISVNYNILSGGARCDGFWVRSIQWSGIGNEINIDGYVIFETNDGYEITEKIIFADNIVTKCWSAFYYETLVNLKELIISNNYIRSSRAWVDIRTSYSLYSAVTEYMVGTCVYYGSYEVSPRGIYTCIRNIRHEWSNETQYHEHDTVKVGSNYYECLEDYGIINHDLHDYDNMFSATTQYVPGDIIKYRIAATPPADPDERIEGDPFIWYRCILSPTAYQVPTNATYWEIPDPATSAIWSDTGTVEPDYVPGTPGSLYWEEYLPATIITVENNMLELCYDATGSLYPGIAIRDTEHVNIIGNTVRGAKYSGVLIENCNGGIISDNLCVDNGTKITLYQPYHVSGIYLANARNFLINNNTCHDTRTTKLQDIGIYESSNCDNNMILSNNVHDNGTSQIVSLGTGTSVRDNIGYTDKESGSATIEIGTSSILVDHSMPVAPSSVIVTFMEYGDAARAWVTSVTATHFIINVDAVLTAEATLMWEASI